MNARAHYVCGAVLVALTLIFPATPLNSQLSNRDTLWQQDLQYLATELPKRHPNFFFQLNKTDFDKAVSDLNAAIPTLADHEIIAGMARITALAGDGHTSLMVNQAAANSH